MLLRLWMPARACPLRREAGPSCCLRAPDCPLAARCPLRLVPADTEFRHVHVTHGGIMADLGVPDAEHAGEVLDGVEEAGERDVLVWGLPGPHPELPVALLGGLTTALADALPHLHVEPPHHA